MKSKLITIFVFITLLCWVGGGDFAYALYSIGNLKIGGYLKNETYIRVGHGPDRIMSFRNLLNLDLDYKLPTPIAMRFFLQLRPVYDAVFDIENKGTGGGTSRLRNHFQDNFGVADDWEPLVREVWIEFIWGSLQGRLGRQLVSWGRSDGIYLLDLIHPFNYRNWSLFEEEDTKIPLWMINLSYWVKPEHGFQFLFIPRYVPSHSAFDGHDWAAEVTKLVDDYYYDPFFYFYNVRGLSPAWGLSIPVKTEEPAKTWGNADIGIKWVGLWKGIAYSLNYLYTWDDIMTDHFDPISWSVTRKPDRISVMGGSFDYQWQKFLGLLENLVTRGEIAYFKNDVFVDDEFNNHDKDHIDYMLGFDKYAFVDWWISIQLWQSWIINPNHWKNSYLSVAAQLKELRPTGIIDPLGFPLFEADWTGYRDAVETLLSFYVMKDFLPSKIFHTEYFLLWDPDDDDIWVRLKCKYDFSDAIYGTVGFNFYWGNRDASFGQFRKNDSCFIELKYCF